MNIKLKEEEIFNYVIFTSWISHFVYNFAFASYEYTEQIYNAVSKFHTCTSVGWLTRGERRVGWNYIHFYYCIYFLETSLRNKKNLNLKFTYLCQFFNLKHRRRFFYFLDFWSQLRVSPKNLYVTIEIPANFGGRAMRCSALESESSVLPREAETLFAAANQAAVHLPLNFENTYN